MFYTVIEAYNVSYESYAFKIGLDSDLDYNNDYITAFSKIGLMSIHFTGSSMVASPFIHSLKDRIIENSVFINRCGFNSEVQQINNP